MFKPEVGGANFDVRRSTDSVVIVVPTFILDGVEVDGLAAAVGKTGDVAGVDIMDTGHQCPILDEGVKEHLDVGTVGRQHRDMLQLRHVSRPAPRRC